MTKEQATEILEHMPEDIYTLDGIVPTETELWFLGRAHKRFSYKDNNQNINIHCIVDYKEGTFNLIHIKHNTKQKLPLIYKKIGERLIAYFSIFGLKRNFYL